jgi:porphobilinogen deaminase
MLGITGSVIALDGSVQVRDTASGPIAEPVKVGRQLANRLIERGAEELL